jgi:hypothetical protein
MQSDKHRLNGPEILYRAIGSIIVFIHGIIEKKAVSAMTLPFFANIFCCSTFPIQCERASSFRITKKNADFKAKMAHHPLACCYWPNWKARNRQMIHLLYYDL